MIPPEDNLDALIAEARDQDPAVALPAIRDLREWLEQVEESSVLRATVEGWPWSRIGEELGTTRENAWYRHHSPGDVMPQGDD